ncbi:hypothetical protein AB0I28_32385 [Phytomonospora sp. NPDC050363]|uniref:hypothetical protein n=1 Tax=Phytomonospora sp. NPDC050363 TaxID=3155642 RepID=UPI0033C31CC9
MRRRAMTSLAMAVLTLLAVLVPTQALASVTNGTRTESHGPASGQQTWTVSETYSLIVNPHGTWSAGTCADSVFDWKALQGGLTKHHDAAIARTCDYRYGITTPTRNDSGSARSLIGSQKLATCVGADDHTMAAASLCTNAPAPYSDMTVVGNVEDVVPSTCARTWLVEWGGYGPTENSGGNQDDCYS